MFDSGLLAAETTMRDHVRMAAKQTKNKTQPIIRCAWPKNELAIAYHDTEWGKPEHDDVRLFEHLILDGAQAGLSWDIILRKRDRYRQVFDGFDPQKVARYNKTKINHLLNDPGIVRNRLKVESAVTNARACLKIQDQFGSLDACLWRFVDGRPIINAWETLSQLPATSPQSDAMSKELKKFGFKFVGSTICYAFMQAVGMINDHTTDCFRYQKLKRRA